MRESSLYLKFFKENLVLILLPLLIFTVASFIYQGSKHPLYRSSILLQMQYTDTNVADRISLTDEMVAEARSAYLRGDFQLKPGESVNVFKPSPLSAEVSLISTYPSNDVTLVVSTLTSRFPAKQIGERIDSVQKSFNPILIFIGSSVGLAIGLLISLTKSYFKNF